MLLLQKILKEFCFMHITEKMEENIFAVFYLVISSILVLGIIYFFGNQKVNPIFFSFFITLFKTIFEKKDIYFSFFAFISVAISVHILNLLF
jgi:hypothetical protein